MRFLIPAAACVAALSAAPACAATIVYSVNNSVGSVGQVTGTITTDGATGTISAANILAWNLNVAGNGASTLLTNANSGVFGGGTALSATTSKLSFNFSDPTASFLLFQSSFSSGTQYACEASTPAFSTPCYQGLSAVPASYNDPSAQYSGQGAGGVLLGTLDIGSAIPEPATWALMLLGFGMTGFAMRKRSNVRTTVSYAK